MMANLRKLLMISLVALSTTISASPGDWIRPESTSAPLVWGLPDGLVFGLPSDGGMRGPAGLIRIGIVGRSGEAELINFIAIEPVIKGKGPRHKRLSLSELEMSQMAPGKRGKRLWTENFAGELSTSGSVENLSVRIEVEPFVNGAHVFVIATVSSDRPDELKLEVHHHDDSVPIDELTLTATMGNYERLRHLWLEDRVVDSRDLFGDYTGTDFVEKETYPHSEMLTSGTDKVVMATTNEQDPSSVQVAARPNWTYKSKKLTQYWRVPERHVQPNLRVRVNGRRVYWASKAPIPGGVSFENFEVRQQYVPGQVFIFGLTEKEPWELVPGVEESMKRSEKDR